MRELRVTGGPLEATVLPDVGARLHSLRAFGHDLLHTPEDPEQHRDMPFAWGAYVMAPWCNRVSPRRTVVEGRTVDLPVNFPDGSAIHGQVYARPWSVDADGRTCRVTAGGDGWPWAYEAGLAVVPTDAGLRLELTLLNRSDGPMPAGIGLHPWWRRPLLVAIEAEAVYPSNTDPGPGPTPVSGSFDLRSPSVPPVGLDATWTALGARPVQLLRPDRGVAVDIALNGADFVAMATPAGDATAVEVQTHAPFGLAHLVRGEPGAMAVLDPGAALRMSLDIAARRL